MEMMGWVVAFACLAGAALTLAAYLLGYADGIGDGYEVGLAVLEMRARLTRNGERGQGDAD